MKYFLLVSCLVAIACNNDSAKTNANDSTSTVSPRAQNDSAALVVTPSCYAHQTSNNLVLLKLNTVSPAVSGHLTYATMGKDKNEGIVNGIMRGDTLFAYYNFLSEGKRSVREVAFLKRGETFVEGYGESIQKGDTMLFSRRDTVDFNGTMVLTEVPCTD